MTLNDEQLQHYRDEGYVLVGRVLDDATLEAIHEEEARFRAQPLKNDQDTPGQGTLFRSQVCNYSQPVRDFAMSGPHLEFMRQLIGPNLCLWYNQFVTKLPDQNLNKSEFPWHQDNGYVSVEPATNVTLWIALDDVDLENGCVWVMPKSHQLGLLDHSKQSEASWFLNVPVEGDGVPAILKAGEGVAFTGLTLHRSKLNKTDRVRRGFFLEYAQADAVMSYDKSSVLNSPDSWMVCGNLELPVKL